MLIVLTAFVISSCEKENAPPTDPLTEPNAHFFCETRYQSHLENGTYATYAYVKATNNSTNSNRWEWQRPDSREVMSGDIKFMTTKDTAVTQVYLATNEEQIFTITLTAYSDMPIGINPDSTIIYKTFESRPFVQEVKVKKL